jgi:hypothetical protein
MAEYTKTILVDFPEAISIIKTTLAGDHLFQVRNEDEARLLPEEQATSFHHVVRHNSSSSALGHAAISNLLQLF